jgi:hypothetical protein
LQFARAHAETVGRTAPLDVCCALFSRSPGRSGGADPVELADEVAELEALGVSWITVQFDAPTRREWRNKMERFAATAGVTPD